VGSTRRRTEKETAYLRLLEPTSHDPDSAIVLLEPACGAATQVASCNEYSPFAFDARVGSLAKRQNASERRYRLSRTFAEPFLPRDAETTGLRLPLLPSDLREPNVPVGGNGYSRSKLDESHPSPHKAVAVESEFLDVEFLLATKPIGHGVLP
jgi:hypothetical protein